MTAPSHTSRTRRPSNASSLAAPWWVRATVYTLLLVVVIAGVWTSTASTAPPAPSASPELLTAPLPATSPSSANAATCFGAGPDGSQTVFGEFYSCDPTVPSQLARVSPEDSSPPIRCEPDKANGCFWRYADDPSSILPAWRWRDDVGLYSNMTGLAGTIPTLFSFLASVFFAVSQLAWWLLLEVSQWVLTDSLVQDAGAAMNTGYTILTDLINASGLLLIAAAVGLFILIKLLARGRVVKVLGLVLAFIIPIAAMQGLAANASKSPAGSSTAPSFVASDLPTGSPAWLAVSGVNIIDGFTSWFTSGFGRLATISGSLQIQQASAVDPSCSSYVAAMYDQYYAYASSPIQDIRNQSRIEFERQMTAFESDPAMVRKKQADPFLYSQVYGSVANSVLIDVQQSIQPPDPESWQGLLAGRSSAEKLVDARNYKVATVSQLWQRAFLGSWTAAQFGNEVAGARMYCHLLESNADIPPEEQLALAEVANRYAYVTGYDGNPTQGPGYRDVSLKVFEKASSKLELEQQMFSWAACRRAQMPGGSWEWKAEPAWAALGDGHGITDEICEGYFENQLSTSDSIRNSVAGILEGAANFVFDPGCGFTSWTNAGKTILSLGTNCAVEGINTLAESVEDVPVIGGASYLSTSKSGSWFADLIADTVEADSIDRSGAIKALQFDSEDDVNSAVDSASSIAVENRGKDYCDANPAACADLAAQGYGDAKDAGKMIMAFKGNNPAQRLSMSLLALVTSLVYVYSLGFLSLGAFIAKFGLVLMIILLPATLLAMAWPSATGGGSSQTGKKMLRLTGGFILSHGLLAFVLGLLLSTIILFESFIGGDGGSFIHALIPLASLFVVRKLLKMAGLGDLGSMQGALGMPLSASLAAAGKDWQMSGMGTFNSLTGGKKFDPKTGQWKDRGLSRMDALAKRTGKGALMFAPRAGSKASRWTGRKIADGGSAVGSKVADRYALSERKGQLLGTKKADGTVLEGGLAQRMKSMAGLMSMSAAAAKKIPGAEKLGNRLGIPKAAKEFSSFAQRKSSRIRKQVAQDKTYQDNMRRRREAIHAISGRPPEERHAARTKYQQEVAAERQASEMALRDGDDAIIRDEEGRPIYGYEYSKQLESKLGTPIVDVHGRPVYAAVDSTTKGHLDAEALSKLPTQEQQRNASGNLITGKGGKAIYGWAYDDGVSTTVLNYDEYRSLSPEQKNSTVEIYDKDKARRGVQYVHDASSGARIIDAEQLAALSPAEQARAVAITNPDRTFLRDGELREEASRYAKEFHLRDGQMVSTIFGSSIVAPAMGDANGNNRIVITQDDESTKKLAAHYRIQYLPNSEKERPPGMSDDGYAMMLKLLNEYHSGYNEDGSLRDIVYELTGHAWDSAVGERELNLLLENKDGVLKNYRPETPPEILASIRAAAKEYVSGSDKKQVFIDLTNERRQAVADIELERATQLEIIMTGQREVDALNAQKSVVDARLKEVRVKRESFALQEARFVELEEALEDLDSELEKCNRDRVAATLSLDPAERARIGTINDKIQQLSTRRSVALSDREEASQELEKIQRELASWDATSADLDKERINILESLNELTRRIASAARDYEETTEVLKAGSAAVLRDIKDVDKWSDADAIEDAINSKYDHIGRQMEDLQRADLHDRLPHVINKVLKDIERSRAEGDSHRGHILNQLAKRDGAARHADASKVEALPWA